MPGGNDSPRVSNRPGSSALSLCTVLHSARATGDVLLMIFFFNSVTAGTVTGVCDSVDCGLCFKLYETFFTLTEKGERDFETGSAYQDRSRHLTGKTMCQC